MYKLIALDIDGTLLNTNKEVTIEVFEAIQNAKEQGVKVVLSTGRPLPGVKPLLDKLQLNNTGDYVVCFNGAVVQDIGNEAVVSKLEMSVDDFKYINNIAKENNLHIHINTPDAVLTPNENVGQYTLLEADLNKIPYKYIPENEINDSVTFCKIMIIDEPDLLEELLPKLPKEAYDKYTIVRSAPFFLEFLNKDANKGTGMEKLCKELNITADEVIAVGDEENDRHMIEFAGLGVAMGNARDSIKEIADYITDTNDNHGVAKVIDKFILNK